MPEPNETNGGAPIPPDAPTPSTPASAQTASDSPTMSEPTVVSPDTVTNSTGSQASSNDLGSPVVSRPNIGAGAGTGETGETRWPGYIKLAVATNIMPIATATGFVLFFTYWAFFASASSTGSEGDASGLVSFIAFILLCVALVALSGTAVPLVIALASRKKVAAYIASGIGIIGSCLAVALLVATFAG